MPVRTHLAFTCWSLETDRYRWLTPDSGHHAYGSGTCDISGSNSVRVHLAPVLRLPVHAPQIGSARGGAASK